MEFLDSEEIVEKCLTYGEIHDIITHFVARGIISLGNDFDEDEVFQGIVDNHLEELNQYITSLVEAWHELNFC